MAPRNALDQRLAAVRTFRSLVTDDGRPWWAALDGLQLSPTQPFDGPSFRGRDRLILAMAALERGHRDRRWSTREALKEHSLVVSRGEHPVALDDGGGLRLLYNLEQAHPARGRRARRGTTLEQEVPAVPIGAPAIAVLCRALASGAPCRVLYDGCADVTCDASLGVVLVPNDPRWGREAKDLQALLEAVALSLATTGIHGIEGDAACGLVASIASAMALSDLGVAPSVASVVTGHERRQVCGSLPWAETGNDVEVLLTCADAADEVSGLLTGVLGDAVGRGDVADDLTATDATRGEGCGEEGTRRGVRSPDVAGTGVGHTSEHVPAGEGDAIPYGRYTLKDTVSGARHASDALSGRFMGTNGGCGY